MVVSLKGAYAPKGRFDMIIILILNVSIAGR